MRSKLTLGLATLATVALASGIAVAAPASAFRADSTPNAMMSPNGATMAGPMALKSAQSHNLGPAPSVEMFAAHPAGSMERPQAAHGWSDGLEALAAASPQSFMAPTSAEHALMAPQGMAATTNGFAAMKQASSLGSGPSPDVQNLRSSTATADLYSRHSK